MDRGSLQAVQNSLLSEILKFSSGNCFKRSEGDTDLGSPTFLPLDLLAPFGGGLVESFRFLAKSGLLSLLRIDSVLQLVLQLASVIAS